MTDSILTTVAYLRMLQRVHHTNAHAAGIATQSPVDFVLTYGTQYHTVHALAPTGQPRQCFRNAFEAAMRLDLTYVEGWANSIIPTEHAWCVTPDGKIYDPTWGRSGHDYFGVALPIPVLEQVMSFTGVYGVYVCWTVWDQVLAILNANLCEILAAMPKPSPRPGRNSVLENMAFTKCLNLCRDMGLRSKDTDRLCQRRPGHDGLCRSRLREWEQGAATSEVRKDLQRKWALDRQAR
jgi:hypothetical protein